MDIVKKLHKKEYSVSPAVVASAPGRFHLIGEHTWFFRDKTLSMAVNLPVYVAVSKRKDQNLCFNFVQLEDKKKASLSSLKLKKEDKWANVLKAVVFAFQTLGYELTGMDFTVYTDILPSAGFGITTAIKVASAWAIREMFSIDCADSQLLRVLETANRKFLMTENILADNLAAVFSKENSLILTDYARSDYETIPFSFEDKTVILTDARVPRIVTWNEDSLLQPENVLLLGELKERKSNVRGGWVYEEDSAEVGEVLSVASEETKRRLICNMNEHKYVLDAVSALEKKDFANFARAVNRSHENMRDLYDISCPEIDWILKRVRELDEAPDDLRNPVNCGRITGKGFGRCTYSILRKGDVEKYREKLAEYERIFGFKPFCYEVEPAGGVCIL
ncbi:MAG: galactokinase [Treponema sp.]|nr:galactokinase [Treponema sp.]